MQGRERAHFLSVQTDEQTDRQADKKEKVGREDRRIGEAAEERNEHERRKTHGRKQVRRKTMQTNALTYQHSMSLSLSLVTRQEGREA
mmetsp:Transcript_13679/g.27206  ORF Transcript_13679/g.27206 Transcript_13679/m.27206 type:complete len:88 (-) Transcript_13679:1434-1697(-)